MTVKVNKNLCIGCGSCVSIDPDTFELGDEGFAEVKGDEVSEGTKEAAEACPVEAIIIEE